ncbi:hypothetical protein RUM44_001637 [Polyplax serrata]|uniref:Uncharacterized protein n=1 Tax=Polyplax serrata TaxID=468196 RepID=A0ABR1AKN5_POLSC
MASPVDVSSNESDFLQSSPIYQCPAIDSLKEEDSSETPLQTPWTLWLDKTIRGLTASEYESSLKKIYTFSTIEGFWAVFNNIPDVREIQSGYSYHMMREERRPIWEESYNKKGGTWRFRCNKSDTSKVWKELLLAAIGEQFLESLDPHDEVCGLTVSVRDKFDVVRLWNVNAQLEKKATIVNKVYKLLPDVEFAEPFYKYYLFERECD